MINGALILKMKLLKIIVILLLLSCLVTFSGCSRKPLVSIPKKISTEISYNNGYYDYEIEFKAGFLKKIQLFVVNY